ncbi:MAG TPA: ElyC/SanA/YdcF family protein [Holophagaceae bacterium]|nr:ElyC/SanA/YdcF family protein [Holophagaceae bacterium]
MRKTRRPRETEGSGARRGFIGSLVVAPRGARAKGLSYLRMRGLALRLLGRKALWIGLGLALLLGGDLLWALGRFPSAAKGRVFAQENLPAEGCPVLVLGAGVYGDGEPTAVLEARLRASLDLWRAGKVRWFLVSGDNRTLSYNEPQAMRKWLLKQGVPPILIVNDYAGRRTYDSLRRARDVFGQRKLVVVTSDFHMARALFLARALGMEAYGVPASSAVSGPFARARFWIREIGARHLAWWDSRFPPSDTVLGPREPTPDDLLAVPAKP